MRCSICYRLVLISETLGLRSVEWFIKTEVFMGKNVAYFLNFQIYLNYEPVGCYR